MFSFRQGVNKLKKISKTKAKNIKRKNKYKENYKEIKKLFNI